MFGYRQKFKLPLLVKEPILKQVNHVFEKKQSSLGKLDSKQVNNQKRMSEIYLVFCMSCSIMGKVAKANVLLRTLFADHAYCMRKHFLGKCSISSVNIALFQPREKSLLGILASFLQSSIPLFNRIAFFSLQYQQITVTNNKYLFVWKLFILKCYFLKIFC